MQSMLNPAHGDPCDLLEIAPDIVLVARAEEELSRLARDAKTRATKPPQLKPGPTVFKDPSVPPIDTGFRATAINRIRPTGLRATRRFVGVLLAIGLGLAALTLKVSGDVVQQVIAAWIPAFAARSESPENPAPQEQSAATAQPAAAAAAALPPVQPADATTQNGVAPAAAPDQAQMLQSMQHHLANLRQEVEELKGQLAEMKANQEQMSREAAEPRDRTKLSALPQRAAPSRRQPQAFRPAQTAAAPVAAAPPGAYVPPPPQAAPYVPPSAASTYAPPPPAVPQAQYDPNAPRPPLPVRE
jgi:hypothetical protein